jgi:hypothetical protein
MHLNVLQCPVVLSRVATNKLLERKCFVRLRQKMCVDGLELRVGRDIVGIQILRKWWVCDVVRELSMNCVSTTTTKNESMMCTARCISKSQSCNRDCPDQTRCCPEKTQHECRLINTTIYLTRILSGAWDESDDDGGRMQSCHSDNVTWWLTLPPTPEYWVLKNVA